MNEEKSPLLLEDGRRLDGRGFQDLRPIEMQTGILGRADGSCYLKWGNNKIICAIYGPRELHPKHLAQPDRAIVRVEYRLATFSVGERKSPAPRRREYELSKILSESINSALFLEKFPTGTIDVFITVLDADGGTRCAALTAASLGLADAGIPMRGIITGCAVGKVGGEIAVDLSDVEDKDGEGDMPVAMIYNTGEITLLQCDGVFTPEEVKEGLKAAKTAIGQIYQFQRSALLSKYSQIEEPLDELSDEEE
ncbi:MAG: exosome complex exonuclease Rrp41 [Candidatus Heimdallarchaeota archaeon]|nr:MAG: exosome complex exonuclease Rrp41 [Candidatus Heimdallarchaeota archaeon]